MKTFRINIFCVPCYYLTFCVVFFYEYTIHILGWHDKAYYTLAVCCFFPLFMGICEYLKIWFMKPSTVIIPAANHPMTVIWPWKQSFYLFCFQWATVIELTVGGRSVSLHDRPNPLHVLITPQLFYHKSDTSALLLKASSPCCVTGPIVHSNPLRISNEWSLWHSAPCAHSGNND